jgi:hypothetical protein
MKMAGNRASKRERERENGLEERERSSVGGKRRWHWLIWLSVNQHLSIFRDRNQ